MATSNKLPPQPVGVAPGSSYWNDWYEKLRRFVDTVTTSVSWSIITGTPTTLTGYGVATTGTLGSAVQSEAPTINNILLTGSVTSGGNVGVSATITTAKLTPGGTNGSMTFTNGILTSQTPAT